MIINKKTAVFLRKKHQNDEDHDNLGLDADHSSDDLSNYDQLNNDNDRISGNPDGEDDQNDTEETPGYSPLTDK